MKYSKAVLVFEMPDSCIYCPCYRQTKNGDDLVEDCKVMMMALNPIERDEVPDWCPLKPIPQKKNATKEWVKNSEDIAEAMKIGWNACLDEIEK